MDNNAFIERIGDSSPLLRFLAVRDLLEKEEGSVEYDTALNGALEDPFLLGLKDELLTWPGPVLKRHNDAKLLLHKLAFYAELDLPDEDYHRKISDLAAEQKTEDGVYSVLGNVPKQFGGTGVDSYSWMLCDAPLLLYCLVKLQVDHSEFQKGFTHLLSLGRDYGFPCAASPDLGRFNGPGKRGTFCPYASLLMVRLFSALPGSYGDSRCAAAAEALLNHCEKGGKSYLFGAGSKFHQLKYPFIWYDILHMTEVLTRFPQLRKDHRLIELVEDMRSKLDDYGLCKAESVWMAWKGIDAGQKKLPSLWITYSVRKIIKRMNLK